MEPITIFWVITGIFIFNFILERVSSALEASTLSPTLPNSLKGFYDEEKYARQQAYKKENMRFGLISSIISFIGVLVILFSGIIPVYDAWISGITDHYILRAFLFLGIAGLAADLLGTPFAIYGTFVIEKKYGFNKTTPATFIFDKIKGYLLGGILGGGVLALIMYLHVLLGSYFWLAAFGVMVLLMTLMNMFFAHLFLPLFNKLKPLSKVDLSEAIQLYAGKSGFKVKNIFEIDGSKRSTKANAFFSGFGPSKRIVLYDTLVNDYHNDEIVAVLAHEVGHSKHKHTLTGLIAAVLQIGIMIYLFGLVIDNDLLAQSLGVAKASFHINMLVFGMLYTPVSMLTGIFMNMWSRKNEYQADAYAAKTYKGSALASALKKLSTDSLANLQPHPLNVFLHYSHPPVIERIKAIEKAGA